MVAKAAPELTPKRVIDTATASSKKFEAAIIDPGQEIEYFCLKNFIEKAVKQKIKRVCIINGIEIKII